jgi:hypothetical protein
MIVEGPLRCYVPEGRKKCCRRRNDAREVVSDFVEGKADG